MTCEPFEAAWTPDLTRGMLEFLEPFSGSVYYTIPNHAVRFMAEAETDLLIRTLDDSDIDTSSDPGSVPPSDFVSLARPRRERMRSATLYLQMTFWYDEAGVAHPNAAEGRFLNWANLNAVANVTLNRGTDFDAYSAAGLQTMRWTPYDGATPITVPETRVLPPQPGNLNKGIGMTVTMQVEVTDPSVLP